MTQFEVAFSASLAREIHQLHGRASPHGGKTTVTFQFEEIVYTVTVQAFRHPSAAIATMEEAGGCAPPILIAGGVQG